MKPTLTLPLLAALLLVPLAAPALAESVPTNIAVHDEQERGVVAAESRPNLVMILTDDQRHDAAGFTGNTAIHTPNLDRLAKAGLIFKNCFVNTAICAVNRANFMAGQYPSRHGIDGYIDPTPPFEQLFDLQADPDQLRNLAGDPAHAALLEKLRHRCDQLAVEVGPSP